jgi:hypothetical protein
MRSNQRVYRWILLAILLGQALLLSYRLADQSMWTDEMYTYRIVVSSTVSDALAQISLTETRPPLRASSAQTHLLQFARRCVT